MQIELSTPRLFIPCTELHVVQTQTKICPKFPHHKYDWVGMVQAKMAGKE